MSVEHPGEHGDPVWWQRLPLAYAATCKRSPDSPWPFATTMVDDLAILLIAFALFTPSPLLLSVAVLCLHLSFWCIYEAGYYENDIVAMRHEVNGEVPQRFGQFARTFSEARAWAAALVLGAAGAYLVSGAEVSILGGTDLGRGQHTALVLAVWVVALVALRVLYRTYNRIDKMTRVHLYLPLQVMKYGFPALFLPLPPAGAALVFAQILRRWLPYIIYRFAGIAKGRFPVRLVRLAVFVLLWLLLLPSSLGAAFAVQGAAGAAFLTLRARTQLAEGARAARPVRQDAWAPAPSSRAGLQRQKPEPSS